MKFKIDPGYNLKGLSKNLSHFDADIIKHIPPGGDKGFNVHLLYRPKILCFVDLTGNIEEFAKIRALEMYLKDNNIDVDFKYKPLPEHKFNFEITDNIVKVAMPYFYNTYTIQDVSVETGALTATITKAAQ